MGRSFSKFLLDCSAIYSMGFLKPDLEGAYHFTEHFAEVAKGSRAEKAQLDVENLVDFKDSYALDIMLDRVEVED